MKILLCFFSFFIFLFINDLHGQTSPSIEWQTSLGGSGSDQAYAIEKTTDGGYIVAGTSASLDGDVSGNHGGADFWIVRLDASGNIIWEKSLGGSAEEIAYAVKQTKDGGFIAAGSTTSNNIDVSGNHGSYDYWVVKLDSIGNLIWQKCLGGSSNEIAYSVQQTNDEGFIVAGYTQSNNGNVSGNNGYIDFWIVKLDTAGNLVWQKALGGSNQEVAFSILQTPDGGCIAAGFNTSNDGDISGNHGSGDYWIVKLNAAGNLTWEKSYGGSSDEQAQSIQPTIDGGYILAGSSQSHDGQVSVNHGNNKSTVGSLLNGICLIVTAAS